MLDPFRTIWQKIHHRRIITFTAVSMTLLLGLGLRLFKLGNQSLWYDEAFSVYTANLPFSEMTAPIVDYSWNHPPLYYYLLRIWLLVFGFSDFRVRLFSVIFGILTILVLFLLAKNIFDQKTGYFAAFLMTISQIGIMYSQEARPYSQLLFFEILTIYFFHTALYKNNKVYWWGFILSAMLMLYTNYYSGIVLIILLLSGIIFRGYYKLPVRTIIIGGLLTGLSLVPWLLISGVYEQFLQNQAFSESQPIWFSVEKNEFINTINAFNNGLSEGLLQPSPRWTYFIGGILITLPALIALLPLFRAGKTEREANDKKNLIFLLLLTIMPIVAVQAVSKKFNIQYDTRYILYTIVPYYILSAKGLISLKFPAIRVVYVLLILGYSLNSLQSNYFKPYKENYRDALAYLAERYEISDCVTFLPYSQIPFQWSVYHQDGPNLKLVDPEKISMEECERIWVVAYRRVQPAKKDVKEKLDLLDKDFLKSDESKYLFVHVYLYEHK